MICVDFVQAFYFQLQTNSGRIFIIYTCATINVDAIKEEIYGTARVECVSWIVKKLVQNGFKHRKQWLLINIGREKYTCDD